MTETITLHELGPDDLDRLLSVPPGLFDNPVDPDAARAFLADPGHVMVLAYDEKTAVAFATGTVLLHPDKAPSFFVNEVATSGSHLRRGLATRCTAALMEIARARGCQGIWLATEPDNGPALGLYRAMGGNEVPVVCFDWDDAL